MKVLTNAAGNWQFSINAGTYLKILWQVAELDLKDPVTLQEQLVGVDVAYFSMLIDVLKNIDPEKLTYNYISEIKEANPELTEEDDEE